MPLALLLLMAAAPARAAHSYDNCTGFIDSLPVTITTQGTWCLRKDLSTSIKYGVAVQLATNNVTLDCNDFKIAGSAAFIDYVPDGIQAQDRLNITVRNCRVEGFTRGLSLAGAAGGGHVVEDNRFTANTFVGMLVEGDGSVVRRNFVGGTGRSMTPPYDTHAYGIVTAQDVDIVDNEVSGVQPYQWSTGNAFGIVTRGSSATVARNRISGAHYGISDSESTRIVIRENEVLLSGGSDTGITCASPLGRAERNVIVRAGTPLVTCSSLGNDVLP
ncbi:right-handed parallel beta-helix repeat-containing protein [Agrilutibacter solisilvae]|uniref:Right-handed parallel beta-helix repeat-containing protein n=1 Tax=Agrilutibacter solisilvae TaxID=2763317 RepID=A0A974XW97_9GAMM|nr:right-handed parallel beta-helix repeat-containing protein [Lysobacter solisilvae]QSX76918.1 right-handed parallel beta-helix repeat-containing protein [Lysobacter solisilvae]